MPPYCRFLYPIYPLICIAASAVIESFPDFFRDKYNPNKSPLLVSVSFWYLPIFAYSDFCCFHDQNLIMSMQIAKVLRPLVLGLILWASHARTFSLINGYSAPLVIYKHLEYHDDAGEGMNFNCISLLMILKLQKVAWQF